MDTSILHLSSTSMLVHSQSADFSDLTEFFSFVGGCDKFAHDVAYSREPAMVGEFRDDMRSIMEGVEDYHRSEIARLLDYKGIRVHRVLAAVDSARCIFRWLFKHQGCCHYIAFYRE